MSDSYWTYFGRGVSKFLGSFVVSGSDDALSAATAEMKVDLLGDVLQVFFQARAMEFDGKDIGIDDCRSAILYARGKKHAKAVRRAAAGTAKLGLQVAAMAGGATVGSVIPIAGTAAGGVAGAVAGASLSPLVSVADYGARGGKALYKIHQGTRGVHREQAAKTLMHCSQRGHIHCSAATTALRILLGEEFDRVTQSQDVDRLASRMKSN